MRASLRLGFFAAALVPAAVPTPPPDDDLNRPVAFYAFLDLQGSPLHRKYLNEEQIRQFSPSVALSQSAGPIPPIFVARAGQDKIPDLQPGLDHFVSEAIARNVALEFLNQPGGEHGFDTTPGDPRSREIVRQAVDFLQTNLAEK